MTCNRSRSKKISEFLEQVSDWPDSDHEAPVSKICCVNSMHRTDKQCSWCQKRAGFEGEGIVAVDELKAGKGSADGGLEALLKRSEALRAGGLEQDRRRLLAVARRLVELGAEVRRCLPLTHIFLIPCLAVIGS